MAEVGKRWCYPALTQPNDEHHSEHDPKSSVKNKWRQRIFCCQPSVLSINRTRNLACCCEIVLPFDAQQFLPSANYLLQFKMAFISCRLTCHISNCQVFPDSFLDQSLICSGGLSNPNIQDIQNYKYTVYVWSKSLLSTCFGDRTASVTYSGS